LRRSVFAARHERQLRAEIVERLGQGAAGSHALAAAEDRELGLAADARRLDDRVQRALVRVAEDREQRLPVAVVDRVIAPNPANDVPAVQAEKLIELLAGKIQRPPNAAAIVAEGQHRRVLAEHRADRVSLRCHHFDHFRPMVQQSCTLTRHLAAGFAATGD
jgi:hypothetical protein